MTRTLLPAGALAAVLALLLAGCGDVGGNDNGRDNGSDNGTGVDPGAAASTTPSPTPSPTGTVSTTQKIGEHPAYPHADYSYDLEVQCFCPSFGQPVRVTVQDGEVASAVWTKKGPGHARGAEATEEWVRLSINEVLSEAADPRWDAVEVTWPAGQDHPDRVAIDRVENAVDDEVTYLLRNVEPAA